MGMPFHSTATSSCRQRQIVELRTVHAAPPDRAAPSAPGNSFRHQLETPSINRWDYGHPPVPRGFFQTGRAGHPRPRGQPFRRSITAALLPRPPPLLEGKTGERVSSFHATRNAEKSISAPPHPRRRASQGARRAAAGLGVRWLSPHLGSHPLATWPAISGITPAIQPTSRERLALLFIPDRALYLSTTYTTRSQPPNHPLSPIEAPPTIPLTIGSTRDRISDGFASIRPQISCLLEGKEQPDRISENQVRIMKVSFDFSAIGDTGSYARNSGSGAQTASSSDTPAPATRSEQLPHRPESASTARRMTRAALSEWGVDEDSSDQVLLVISELVTNAVEHALPPIALRVARPTPQTVHIEVDDGGPAAEKGSWASTGDADEHGRGGAIVSVLASSHGIRFQSNGSTYWADVPVAA
ncbi:ATP-binding protein [Streptomyces virginiae]|uniref:ATP-binding protein n=1 Tax=Streptomyces virginiae TaxID=1961 RepID=UPI0037233840